MVSARTETERKEETANRKNRGANTVKGRFGTFGGVFTPTIPAEACDEAAREYRGEPFAEAGGPE